MWTFYLQHSIIRITINTILHTSSYFLPEMFVNNLLNLSLSITPRKWYKIYGESTSLLAISWLLSAIDTVSFGWGIILADDDWVYIFSFVWWLSIYLVSYYLFASNWCFRFFVYISLDLNLAIQLRSHCAVTLFLGWIRSSYLGSSASYLDES